MYNFFSFLSSSKNVSVHVGLNPALLYSVSDLTKHIWLAHINQTCFSWLFLSLHSSPSLSLSERTDQWISFCVLLWSATLFYLPGLCHVHVHSALLGCSELWESCCISFGSAGWKGFVRVLILTSHSFPEIATLKTSPPTESWPALSFLFSFLHLISWWIIDGLISLLKESGTAEEAESSVWTLIMSNAWANNMLWWKITL